LNRIHGLAGPPPNPIVRLKTKLVARSTSRKDFAAIVQIHPHAEPELLKVVDATGLAGFSLGFGESRQQHRCENRDNGDDDQQFD
jgi:hypothetical protein